MPDPVVGAAVVAPVQGQPAPVPAVTAPPVVPAPAAAGQPAPADPGPVPYQVFASANQQLRAAEAKAAQLQSQVEAAAAMQAQAVSAAAEAAKADTALRVAIARAGVGTDMAIDYLVSRYTSLPPAGRPEASAWIAALKGSEPAFFGASAVAAPATTTTPVVPPPTPGTKGPTTNPDATAAPGGTQLHDPPLTDEVLEKMDQATFNRRWSEIEVFMGQRRKGR